MRRNQQSALANPVLVGAMTVLVIMVAVFLAYNANNGLPFVPTKELKVDIASGADLVAGNEVREGGFRIGLISAMKPIQIKSTGQIGAQLTLQLNQAEGNVPLDSTVSIRPRSVLGLKFVDLNRGTSHRMYSDGGTMAITHTSVPVQFEDVNQLFDPKTRAAVDKNLVGFGDALAGRGSALNDTFASLPRLFQHLTPVATYLADPSTELIRFFNSLEGFMGTVAPVAGTNARLFTDMATTFEAISRDPNALKATIRQSPSTEAVSTQSLKVQQPFLVDLTTLGHNLAPATAELKAALPVINPAIEVGTRTLARTPSLNANLQQVMDALKNLAQAPGTNMAINALTSTVSTLNPMIRYLGPYQTVCNDWNYFWTYLSEHVLRADQLRLRPARADQQRQLAPAQQCRTGRARPPRSTAAAPTRCRAAATHSRTVSPTAPPSLPPALPTARPASAAIPKKLNHFDPQGRNLGTDIHTPGNQGPTFAGRAKVPAGETFSRAPTTGPLPAYNPSNP